MPCQCSFASYLCLLAAKLASNEQAQLTKLPRERQHTLQDDMESDLCFKIPCFSTLVRVFYCGLTC
jgi:hypothetical protein